MQPRQPKRSFLIGQRFEELESRDLLAAHIFGAATRSPMHHGPPAIFGQQTAGAAAQQQTVLSAQLTDATTGIRASVTFKTGTVDGTTQTSLRVSVNGAEANSTLDVTVGDVLVGTITTDANGRGSLLLSSKATTTTTTSLTAASPLPDDFPTDIAVGTAVSVGSLTGTLAAGTTTNPGRGGGCAAHQGTNLTASLADSGGSATGSATYTSSTRGTASSKLTVSVTGATASSTLDVTVDGAVVGTLTTDASGAGSLELSTANGGTVPTVTAGSTISVGTLSGTFASSTDTSTASSLRGLRRR